MISDLSKNYYFPENTILILISLQKSIQQSKIHFIAKLFGITQTIIQSKAHLFQPISHV